MVSQAPSSLFAIDDVLERNLHRVRRTAARAWREEVPPPPDEWIENSILTPPESEGTPGRISFEQRPWWRYLLQLSANNELRDLCVVAATQVGKTLTMDIALMLYFAEWLPAPAMLVVPDESEAGMIRDRIYAIARESARIAKFKRIRVPSPWRWNMKYIDLGAMRIYLAWSGSKQRTRGKPCWRVWFSEVDAYRTADKKTGDAVEAGRQRVKSRPSFLRVYESSPSESPSRICDIEAASGTRIRWQGKCPHCGRYQDLRFFPHRHGDYMGRGGIVGFKNEESGELVTQEEARKAAHYVCLTGCKIECPDKNAFVEGGMWVPTTCQAMQDGTIEGPAPTSLREVGAVLWSIHSPSVGFDVLAAEYVRAVNEGTVAEFFGNWLAEAHAQRTKVPSFQELAQKLSWTHERRTVPSQAWFLTAGADVQGENNGVRYVVRGWAPGRTSWLVDWGWLERIPGDENNLVKSDLLQLEQAVLAAPFPVIGGPNPLGQSHLQVRLLGIDTNHLPAKIHAWMQHLPESWIEQEAGRVRAFRGDHTVKADVRYRHSLVESNTRTGEKYEGGLHQWGIYVYPFYDQLTEMLASEPGKPGAFYLTSDVAAQGRSYLEQVTNFHRKTEFDSKKGKKRTFWKPKTDRIPVDFWDCEIYALVAAHMVIGDMGWGETEWQGWRSSVLSQQQKRTAAKNVRRPIEDLGER